MAAPLVVLALLSIALGWFGGAFSHQGSNYYAIDFDCPEGTPVLAARDGLVVATHDQAVGNGTTEAAEEAESA